MFFVFVCPCSKNNATCSAPRNAIIYMYLQNGDSALMFSAYRGNADTAEKLIERGAEVNILSKVSTLIVAELQYLITLLS